MHCRCRNCGSARTCTRARRNGDATQLSEVDGFGADACNDDTDNDRDGLVDVDDPGCDDGYDTDETDPLTECNDGLDNDSDGWADLDDPICESGATKLEDDGYGGVYACNDGLDNDLDGFKDAADKSCKNGEDNSESS